MARTRSLSEVVGDVEHPAPEVAPPPKPPSARPARRAPAPEPAKPAAAYSQRINLTVTPEQNRALGQAALDDGVDKTYRLRAMISLWQEDERLRKRVDKRAQQDQSRGR